MFNFRKAKRERKKELGLLRRLIELDLQVGMWAYLAQSHSPTQSHFSPIFVSSPRNQVPVTVFVWFAWGDMHF